MLRVRFFPNLKIGNISTDNFYVKWINGVTEQLRSSLIQYTLTLSFNV